MSKLGFLIALFALGIAAPAWSQESGPSNIRVRKCDPSHDPTKAHCVSAIVFSSNRVVGSPLEIYLQVMNEDHTANADIAPIRLTENEGGANGFPALSPDGKRIVFDSNRLRPPIPPAIQPPANISDLFVMNADGTDQRLLTVAPGSAGGGTSATWSPDGKWIAFHRSASGTGLPIKPDPGAATFDSDIFVMRVPDADEPIEDPINITNTPLFIEDDADWSSDGKKIAFTRHPIDDSQTNSIKAEICVLDLETPDAEPQCLLGSLVNDEEERAPAWSPDGTQIAYMCRKGDPNPQNPLLKTFEICVMNEDGTDQTRKTFNTILEGTPSWSPDGKSIVFSRGPATQAELFVMNPEDVTVTQKVTDTPTRTNLFPNWGELWVGGEGPQ